MIPPDEYNSVVDQIADHLQAADIKYERSKQANREEDEADVTIFRFHEGSETDFFLGIRSDQHYAECIWQFDLIPALGHQFEEEVASKILGREGLPTEPTEEMHETQVQAINILQEISEGDIEEEISGTSLEERLEEDGTEQFSDDIKEMLHELTAAQRALDGLSREQTMKIVHQMDRILKSGNFRYEIGLTDETNLRGFKIGYKIFPYDSLDTRRIYDGYTPVRNYGQYTERFLKITFNIEDETFDWESTDDAVLSGSDWISNLDLS